MKDLRLQTEVLNSITNFINGKLDELGHGEERHLLALSIGTTLIKNVLYALKDHPKLGVVKKGLVSCFELPKKESE